MGNKFRAKDLYRRKKDGGYVILPIRDVVESEEYKEAIRRVHEIFSARNRTQKVKYCLNTVCTNMTKERSILFEKEQKKGRDIMLNVIKNQLSKRLTSPKN